MQHRTYASRLSFLFSISIAILSAPLAATNADAVVLQSHLKCQKALARGGKAYVTSLLKTRLRCDRERMMAPGTNPCSDADVVIAHLNADAKLSATIAKSCDELSAADLGDPRPGGLDVAAVGNSDAYAIVKNTHGALVGRMVRTAHGDPGAVGGTPSEEAMDCQLALDKAVTKHMSYAFKVLASGCHDREDKGKTVTGEVSRTLSACLEYAEPALDVFASKVADKTVEHCSPAALAELLSCPTLTTDRTPEGVTNCLLDNARDTAAASIGSTHGRAKPRIIGQIETGPSGTAARAPAAHAQVVLHSQYFSGELFAGDADATGHIDIEVPALDRVVLCLARAPGVSCSTELIDVGFEPVYFGKHSIDFPLDLGEEVVMGRVLRSDGSPCYESQTDAAFALQGGVIVSPTGSPPSGERTRVSSSGEFVVAVPTSAPQTLHADCGNETVSVDLDPASLGSPVDIHMTNPLPTDLTVTMTDDQGNPITDPSQVQPGDVITLEANLVDADPAEYRWEITAGDGHFLGVTGDDKHAAGQTALWEVTSSGVHQVTVWGSDGKGGIEGAVAPVGPIGPISPSPCLAPPKLQKFLCAQGYTASVPSPAGGLSEFLSYKYRNPSRNSPGDACLYYNLVDPDCIDMNCDGVVDAGTDPLGKCKRTTLGGWWQKNGFDSTGLGADVVSAWYLNSNDLGFGREMHCRVTSWSSLIAERPVAAPTSAERFVQTLREELQSSPVVSQFAKAFNLYPSSVACYVTNYTTDHCFKYPTNDPQNADLAYQGQLDFVANPLVNPTNAYGTVAMEFGPVEGFSDIGPVTKFFVYNGRTAAGQRLTSANLDGCGPKSVPELCMNCHGGDWQHADLDTIVGGLSGIGGVLSNIDANDTVSTDAGYIQRKAILADIAQGQWAFSSFLPFDPDTYVFPAAAPAASQAPNIRSLNKLVLYTKPVNPIRDLINGWYGNNLVSGTFAPWRPTAWNDNNLNPGDESDLYDFVYAKACRVCHAAHFSFTTPGFFPMSSRICLNGSGEGGGSPTMPHAKLTYLNLWKGDYPQALTMSTIEAWYALAEFGFTSCD